MPLLELESENRRPLVRYSREGFEKIATQTGNGSYAIAASGIDIQIAVYGPRCRRDYTMCGDRDGSIIVTGWSYADAIRIGSGRGSAYRVGGDGAAIREGDGAGSAFLFTSWETDYWAKRTGPGKGNAVRVGPGEGDAVRVGRSHGVASVIGGRGAEIYRSQCIHCHRLVPVRKSRRRKTCGTDECKREVLELNKYHNRGACRMSREDSYIHKSCLDLSQSAHKRSKKMGTHCEIDYDEIRAMWQKQSGRCALTGIQFHSGKKDTSKRRPFHASLDRIDREKGYTKKNTRLVCVAVNMALFTWGDSVFDRVVNARYRLRLEKRKGLAGGGR